MANCEIRRREQKTQVKSKVVPANKQPRNTNNSRVRWALGVLSLFLLVCVGFAATTQRNVSAQQTTTASVMSVMKEVVQPVSYSSAPSRPRSIDDEEVDPATWRDIDLVMTKPGGGKLEMGLLRPLWWIAEVGAEEGKTISLSVPEMGVEGPTKVLSIKPMESKENETVPEGMARVTGTFKHSAANVLDLQLESEDKPLGVTYTHPFRSADRKDWVVAGELKVGERVETRTGTTKVVSIKKRPGQVPVYNIEVHKKHTYFVGKSGVWVHNSCVIIEAEQLGVKWGRHKNEFPANWTHLDYRNRINEMFNNPALPRHTYPANSPMYPGETHIVDGADLLRIAPDGTFRSLYKGGQTTYPNGFPPPA